MCGSVRQRNKGAPIRDEGNLMKVFAPCVGDWIDIEKSAVTETTGFLLDIEHIYTCPCCGDDHLSTAPEIEIDSDVDVALRELDHESRPVGACQHIGDVCFGAGPGGGDYRTYLLERDDGANCFNLWIRALDEWSDAEYKEEGNTQATPFLYAYQASMDIVDDLPPEAAAARLIEATWKYEVGTGAWGTNFDHFSVDSGGLLSIEELQCIANRVESEL